MTTSHDDPDGVLRITARLISEDARLDALPRHFGLHMLRLEDTVFDFMRQFAKGYVGGYWDMLELSNGGFYLRTGSEPVDFRVPSNGFEDVMSADAAGITVCLFAYSSLSFQFPAEEIFSRHFYQLRAYGLEHPEASLIFAAID
jgi:Antirestriction protein